MSSKCIYDHTDRSLVCAKHTYHISHDIGWWNIEMIYLSIYLKFSSNQSNGIRYKFEMKNISLDLTFTAKDIHNHTTTACSFYHLLYKNEECYCQMLY